jgi:isoleucyl-tRNA synthetase
MWVCASDYADDPRIGPEILKTTVDSYRKLRNTLRWMLGSLVHFKPGDQVRREQMPDLERLILHRLAELDAVVRAAYADFDYKRIIAQLTAFTNTDLSAFYVDVRKDLLYCDPISSVPRKASLTMIDLVCDTLLRWLAPILPFTCEEAWLAYRGDDAPSVHLSAFPQGLGAGATMRLPRNGAGCARFGASSPARWRSSGRKSASVLRSKQRRSSMCRTLNCSWHCSTSTWPRSRSRRR